MELIAVAPDDPVLRQTTPEISPRDLRTVALQNTIGQLLDFVYDRNNKSPNRQRERPMTVGLSAPQVGMSRRITVVDLAIGSKKFSDIHALINPEIVAHSRAKTSRREGCVNLGTIWGQVERWSGVTVRALDRSGNRLTIEATGWAAVLLQHEIDHLNGRLFIDRLSDPTKALLIETEHYKEYNKKTAADWPYLIDVSRLVRPL